MLLSHNEIMGLLLTGVVKGADPSAVNSASLDLHLGRYILVEKIPDETRETGMCRVVSLRQKDSLCMEKVDILEKPFILRPGQFILAATIEEFNLPLDISSEYKLKSSMARIGLEHLNAGWCDAGWNSSVLTLEFRNLNTFHEIELCYGDRIGQMVFFRHKSVNKDDSYAARGRYNGQTSATPPIPDSGLTQGSGITGA